MVATVPARSDTVGDALEGGVPAHVLVGIGRVHAAGKHAHAVLGRCYGEGGAVGDGQQLVQRAAATTDVHVDLCVVTETERTKVKHQMRKNE